MFSVDNLPSRVRLVEVGPRDGLQNEARNIDVETKLALIRKLAAAGLDTIEAGSFVNPKWVPQMAGSDELFAHLDTGGPVNYTALTPNVKGLERALAAGAREVAVFAAASETFSQRNINCSIDQSLERFQQVCERARDENLKVRGYISCVAGCPYEGEVDPAAVKRVAQALLDMGCYEVSLGDTIGVGTAGQITALVNTLATSIPREQLALHLHDTYGQALANTLAGLQSGITVFDCSVAGLGGCPYAKGATGNVATEDVVYLLNGLGIEHGVDLTQLVAAGQFITDKLGRDNQSRVARALLAKQATP